MVKSTTDGLVTDFNKYVWILSISKLEETMNNHQEISRVFILCLIIFFVITNRRISGCLSRIRKGY
ncbi:MAG: hypothetical protein ACTS7E_01980 [Arsenophonus sp. NC-CH8-MAG3]